MTFVILYIRNDNSIRFQPIVIITIYQYQSNETKILNKIKKSKNPKTRKGLKKVWKRIIPCPSSYLYIYSPSICIYTREMTPNVYLVVLFFLFSFNAKQLLPCLLYFF